MSWNLKAGHGPADERDCWVLEGGPKDGFVIQECDDEDALHLEEIQFRTPLSEKFTRIHTYALTGSTEFMGRTVYTLLHTGARDEPRPALDELLKSFDS